MNKLYCIFFFFLASTGSPGSHSVRLSVCVCVCVCDICALSTLSDTSSCSFKVFQKFSYESLTLHCWYGGCNSLLASTGSPGSHSVCVCVSVCLSVRDICALSTRVLCRSGRYFVLILIDSIRSSTH